LDASQSSHAVSSAFEYLPPEQAEHDEADAAETDPASQSEQLSTPPVE